MKSILVVDDFASVRFYHASLLRRGGYHPLSASNGESALALLASEPVDLIVLDLLMPGMSGAELVHRLRTTPRHAQLPVLVITSEVDHEQLRLLRRDPYCTIVTKPVLPATLLAAVQHHLPVTASTR
jgi:CheY-like chemotaxis protein